MKFTVSVQGNDPRMESIRSVHMAVQSVTALSPSSSSPVASNCMFNLTPCIVLEIARKLYVVKTYWFFIKKNGFSVVFFSSLLSKIPYKNVPKES